MTSKYPQKTTAIKQAGSVPPKTVNGAKEFKGLLDKPLGTNQDWYDLMNKKPLKKLPLRYVLRRGLMRLNPFDTPVQTAIWFADTFIGRPSLTNVKFPPELWAVDWCASLTCGGNPRSADAYNPNSSTCCSAFCDNANTAQKNFNTPSSNGTLFIWGKSPPSLDTCAQKNRYFRSGRAVRRAGAPVPTPVSHPVPVVTGGNPGPMANPLPFPVATPQGEPSKQPVKKANPGEEPSENPEPDKLPDYDLPVFDAPVVLLDPPWKSGINPQVRTQTVSVRGPGQPPRITATRGNPTQSRPGPRKKQDKPNIVKTAGKLWVAINFFTESLDFLEVLWDALPDKCKRKQIREERWGRTARFQADHYSKLEDVYNCLGEIDVAKAITGYINNQIEDYFYGKMSAPTKKLSQQLGIISGLDRAINQAQQWAMKSVDEEGNVEETAILDAFLPKVDFDPNSGEVTLTSLLGETKVNLGTKVF